MSIVGKRVEIVDSNHPHYKENGVVIDATKTVFGSVGMIIKLNNCPLKVESCFVFDFKEIKVID